ncbi:protein FAR1-RELATED SEQUENCE 5-like isoform X2 [Tripterygium wilfordii]|uniref:protein FAR1-RELATED SEQUENCE 5-like isoform X2 n=1 Tax=Tripterygium wilfordii TaxID=458696 RepID=UPI0018F8194A|nr:protein FAR1-RELATED SEQUENCE 5-like isoform X2 [Tripterygium wilfordii]
MVDGTDSSFCSTVAPIAVFEMTDESETQNDGDKGPSKNDLESDIASGVVLGMRFGSADEAKSFYNTYARAIGFSIRARDVKKKDGEDVMREWVCSREGHRAQKYFDRKDRKRRPREETRCGCNAKFRVNFDKDDGKWVISRLVVQHNHALVGQDHIHFLKSHQASPTNEVVIRSGQIVESIPEQAGDCRQQYIQDGDAMAAIGYLEAKKQSDPGFFHKYCITSDGKLGNFFWCDSASRFDYACFGDMLAFDTTYKPFVMLIGMNNHHKTCIFGCASLLDETVESYTWLLSTMVEAMGGKRPTSVITDGDRGMRKAMKTVFPGCPHRLCSRHMMRNAEKEVQKLAFVREFANFMKFREDSKMDDVWDELLRKHDLVEHPWTKEVYKRRKLWSAAFLKGHFFAGQSAIQRCELMNSHLHHYMQGCRKFYEIVKQFDFQLVRVRDEEARAEHVTQNSTLVISTALKQLESHAGEVYTRASFYKFREEMEAEQLFMVVALTNEDNLCEYDIMQYMRPDIVYTVVYDTVAHSINCQCLGFEYSGIPCRHSIHVMKIRHMEEIPASCIMRRWTKSAKSHMTYTGVDAMSPDILISMRLGALTSASNRLCHLASKSTSDFEEVMTELNQLAARIDIRLNVGEVFEGGSAAVPDSAIVPAKRQKVTETVKTHPTHKYSNCNQVDTKQTCPMGNATVAAEVRSNATSGYSTSVEMSPQQFTSQQVAGSFSSYQPAHEETIHGSQSFTDDSLVGS